ncbi:MAG: SCO family protein [Gammaproteobacteria bacterium]|nr:SCO family protein [Gammaproteobacteria bacterium]
MNCTQIKNARSWRAIATSLVLTSFMLLCHSSAVADTDTSKSASGRTYPNVPLINQDGETLHFYDDVIKGKVVTINFMFTSCPDSCPLETAKLRQVQKQLGEHAGKNVYMYSISIDPDRDTPEALKAYMKKFNVGPGWQFLTGKKKDIDLIRKKLGMLNTDEKEFSDHNINFIMGNEVTGRWVKRTPFDVPEALTAVLLGRLQQRSLLASMGKPDYTQSTKNTASLPGEDMFVTRCMACHTIGQGDRAGPDLLNIVSIRDRAWLARWIKEPDAMLNEKDPLATALYERYNKVPMPNLRLTDQEVHDIIDFMDVVSKRVSGVSEKQLTHTSDKTEHSDHVH